jgi:hypothetical protein
MSSDDVHEGPLFEDMGGPEPSAFDGGLDNNQEVTDGQEFNGNAQQGGGAEDTSIQQHAMQYQEDDSMYVNAVGEQFQGVVGDSAYPLDMDPQLNNPAMDEQPEEFRQGEGPPLYESEVNQQHLESYGQGQSPPLYGSDMNGQQLENYGQGLNPSQMHNPGMNGQYLENYGIDQNPQGHEPAMNGQQLQGTVQDSQFRDPSINAQHLENYGQGPDMENEGLGHVHNDIGNNYPHSADNTNHHLPLSIDVDALMAAEKEKHEQALKIESKAREELEDMILRIEKHFKAEQAARKKAEELLQQSIASELDANNRLEDVMKKRSQEQKAVEEERRTIQQERQALEKMRMEFENELRAARGEVAKAQEALAGSEERMRAVEQVERTRIEAEFQSKLAAVQVSCASNHHPYNECQLQQHYDSIL